MVKPPLAAAFTTAAWSIPNYKDFGPRLGLAYSIDSKTVVRSGYGISYTFFNRPGSAQEGINAPQALFGVINQSIPPGGPVPAGFLTTHEQLHHGHRQSVELSIRPIPTSSTFPRNSPWPYVQNWFFSVQREFPKNTVVEFAYNGNHSLHLPILGDYNQAAPNSPGGTLGVQARRPDSSLRPDHLGRSRGQQQLQRPFGARRASLRGRPVFSELVHVGQGAGRFRAGARILTRVTASRPIRRTFTI